VQFHEGELGGAVDGDKQVKFAFSRLNLSNINVEVAERVGLELLELCPKVGDGLISRLCFRA
jgi:hypothetical protein